MPSIELQRRAGDSPAFNNVYIAGIVVVAVLVLCVGVWLFIRWNRKRTAKKRQANMQSAFLSVRGVVKEGTDSGQTNAALEPAQIRPNIAIPDPVATPRVGAGSRNEIIDFYRQSGTFPKPFSFALGRVSPSSAEGGLSPSTPNDNSRVSWVRHSFFSARSSMGGSRYSVMSSTSSFGSEPTTGTARKVRQLFTPVLPDELLLTQLGEHLTIIKSFDDGWCVVGRDNVSEFHQKKSMFQTASPVEENNVELGVVPAWCFLKPVQGLRAERPVRNTSLGITVQMEAPGAPRDNLISWSNF